MASFFRRDDEVQNGLGQAVPNIAVTYYVQPSLALATIYADPNGTTPISNPQLTNGLGQTVAYMASGLYTITYSGAQIQTLTYADQLVQNVASGGLTPLGINPAPNGTVRVFTLAAAPSNPANDQFFVAGALASYSVAYTVSGNTLTWTAATPPQEGDELAYFTS